MNPTVSDDVEWYIFESSSASVPLGERAMRLGPFTCEKECQALLESIKRIPRFSHGTLEVHKKRKRREQRLNIELPVSLCPPAMEERSQPAHTINISKSGARLTGLEKLPRPGEVLELRCGGRKALFQVAWMGMPGTPTQGHVGVECLHPEANVWDLDLTEQSAGDPLLREIELARAVQTRLLPQERPLLKTLDYAGDCLQAHSVGGDYYDFLEMSPGRVGFVLADIAGKGIGAALLMANLQGSLHGQPGIRSKDLPRLLSSLNQHFYRHSEKNVYVTGFFACYSDDTRQLQYVNCGHNPPLLLHRDDAVERLNPTATVLGLFCDWECSVGEAQLEAGDVLSIYTDGVTEATGASGEEFGETRLLEALRQHRGRGAASLLRHVEQAVEQFSSGQQEDDLTLVVAESH
jgi:Stage II sporulation protein E (SpoIIE)